MRVKLEKNYKEHYTLIDVDHAKKVIAFEKEDNFSVKDWVTYAVDEALKDDPYNHHKETLKAEAHTAKNCRAWDLYGATGDMDVFIDAIAETSNNGFIRVGFYLSDAWQTGATPYKHHMYIVNYSEEKN